MEFPQKLLDDAHERALWGFLEGTLDAALREEVRAYYPPGSLLALMPSEQDIRKAGEAVFEGARQTGFESVLAQAPGMRPYFERKSMLHRAYLDEAVRNINEHEAEISRELLGGAKPCHVLAIDSSGADAHNGSKYTFALETDAGRFLYKPRSLSCDAVVRSVCDDLFGDRFSIPRTLDCGSFGFCEYVEQIEPRSEDELDAYFENMGAFCALAYFLSLSDQHAENFQCRAGRLVPIDVETLLGAAALCRTGLADAAGGFSHLASDTVLCTGALAIESGVRCGVMVGGLPGSFKPIDSDTLVIDHKDSILAGFENTFRTCLDNKERLVQAIQSIGHAPVRVILEKTHFYQLVSKRLFNAYTWNDQSMENMRRSLRSKARVSLPEAIIEAEERSILQGDFPFFWITGDSCDLMVSGGAIAKDYFAEPPRQVALRRIQDADADSLAFQKKLIDKLLTDLPLADRGKPPALEPQDGPLTREEALEEAGHILGALFDDALDWGSGRLGLLVARYGQADKKAANAGLGAGYAGVAVFAAACSACQAGDRTHAAKLLGSCLRELGDFARRCATDPERLGRKGALGLADGLGGILRALQLVWRSTRDERVPRIYADILDAIDALGLSDIDECNVYQGLAGLIAAAARSEEGLPACRSIERLADRLLEMGFTDGSGRRIWVSAEGKSHVSGYGKGMAGIGLALLRAWQASGEPRYRDAACEAFAFEDGNYSEEQGLWPCVLREKSLSRCAPGICIGASGLALAFTEARACRLPLADRNLERARACVCALPLEHNDNLCCGTTAIAEALIALGEFDAAGRILAAQVERRKRTGFYIHEDGLRKPYHSSGFLYGSAGVGYTLLRYASAGRVESVFV